MKKLFLTLTLVFFIIPIGISQDLPSYVPTDGLVAYYPFNGNANDESGNGNNPTTNTGAILTNDRNGNVNSAYFFDGINDYLKIEEENICDEFDNIKDITISSWSYMEGNNSDGETNHQTIIGRRDFVGNPTGERHAFELSVREDGELHFTSYNNQDVNKWGMQVYHGIGLYKMEQWNHLTVTFNSSTETLKFFLNGELVFENIYSGMEIYNYNHWINIGAITRKGGNTEFNFWNGMLDDIGIWNRALTEQEIQNLYTSSTGDIILNGVVSAENNQIRNVADPTHTQDAVTLGLLLEKISSLQDQIDFIKNKDNQTDNDGDGYTEVEGDCNDTEASIRPLVFEVADGIDNNCDGNIDEGYNYTPVIDIDGNSYNYAAYGDQVWTVKSAEMVTYRDGTTIPQVTDATEWANLTTGAWCYYDNDPSKGKLYNWYAVAGIHDNDENTPNKELAPEGWHVPTDAEWTELENYLIANGYNYDGTTTGNKIAKSMASTIGWNSSTEQGAIGNNQSLNNSSGFNTLSTPIRSLNGSFGTVIVFWTISENDEGSETWYRQISSSSSTSLGRYSTTGKSGGAQVRFVKD